MSQKKFNQPDVSVLIPLYNKKDYIQRCLRSCLKEQIQNMEVIVVDDRSTDNSLDKILHYSIFDNRIRILENEQNIGLYKTRKRLLHEANGKYILYLDADDILVSGILQNLLTVAHHDKVSVVKGWGYTDTGDSVYLGQTESRHLHNVRQTNFGIEQSLWYHLGSMSLYLYDREYLEQLEWPREIPFMGEDTAINSFALPQAPSISLVTMPIYVLNRTYDTGSSTSSRLDRFHEIVSNQTFARNNLEKFPVAQMHLLQAQLRRRVTELQVIARSHSYTDCEDLIEKYRALYENIDILRYRPGNELVEAFPDAMPKDKDREVAILLRYGSARDLYIYMHDPQDPSARTIINRIKQAWSHLTSFDHIAVSPQIRGCATHGTDLCKCVKAFAAPANDEVLNAPYQTCDFEKLKALLVRLRRKDRVEGSWAQFHQLVLKNTGSLVASLNSRWLLSIVETFGDYGTGNERQAALLVSLMLNMEKTYRTLDKVYCRTRTPVPRVDGLKISAMDPEVASGEKSLEELWDGIIIAAGNDNEDYLINIYRRIGREISSAPAISQICATLLERMFAEPESSLNLIDQFILRYSIRNELISSIKFGSYRQASEDNLIIGYLNREIRGLRKEITELKQNKK